MNPSGTVGHFVFIFESQVREAQRLGLNKKWVGREDLNLRARLLPKQWDPPDCARASVR